jgi:hypothetical protein
VSKLQRNLCHEPRSSFCLRLRAEEEEEKEEEEEEEEEEDAGED